MAAMILQIRHADGFCVIGTVEIIDGAVRNTTECCGRRILMAMKGWSENSVREYAMKCNWIVSVVDDGEVKAQGKP